MRLLRSYILAAFILAMPMAALAQTSVPSYTESATGNIKAGIGVTVLTNAGAGTTAEQVQGNTAAGATDVGNPLGMGCRYQVTQDVVTDGQRVRVACSPRGAVYTIVGRPFDGAAWTLGTISDGQSLSQVWGLIMGQQAVYNGTTSDLARSIAALATSGIGVQAVGMVGQYKATLPTLADTNYGVAQLDVNGNVRGSLVTARNAGTDGFSNANIGQPMASNSQAVNVIMGSAGYKFNGTSWDRDFTCPNTAQISVTAGSTTQIVGLLSSLVVRVCSVSVGISANGTVGVVTGTGANCGTGTATLVADMPLNTGNLWQQSAPEGGSLFRSIVAGELCVKAVTGNVTGSLTFAQY